MGIENRDYVREGDGNSWNGGGMFSGPSGSHSVVRSLIVATLVVFALQCLFTRQVTEQDYERWAEVNPFGAIDAVSTGLVTANGLVSVPQDWLGLDTAAIKKGQIWRVLTTGFCNSRIQIRDLIIHLLILFWLGRSLEARDGPRGFLWFYLTAIVVSSLGFVGLQMLRSESTLTIGASGAIMAILALYAVRHPNEQVNFFGVLPIPIPLIALAFVVYDLSPCFSSFGGPRISTSSMYLSHLFGLAYGLVFWKTEFSLGNLLPKSSGTGSRRDRNERGRQQNDSNSDSEPAVLPFRKPKMKKSAIKLEAELDRVLAKISESGKDSLTAAELKTLEAASQHYSQKN